MSKRIKQLNGEGYSSTYDGLFIAIVPFYFIYWVYTRAKKTFEGAKKRGINVQDNSTVCLVLSLFGFGIISFALIQNNLNGIATQMATLPKENLMNAEVSSEISKDSYNTKKTLEKEDNFEKIKKLSELYEQGILSEDEFNQKKKEILDKI